MKLYTGTKNSPFALDVELDGSSLHYSARSVMQSEFVGDPNKIHPNGANYFDQSLVLEWRGDFGVYGEPVYQRTINLEALRQHPEFGDHASFMLYAPVGIVERLEVNRALFTQTPNLYAMTLASKTDAQAYHATVIQCHPLGHILVPLRSSPTSEWTIGFNVFDPVLIKGTGGIVVVPSTTLAVVRDETLPVVRFMVGEAAVVPAGGELTVNFRLETADGAPITCREAEVYLESTAGYLVARRVQTVNGEGSTTFRPDGLSPGERVKIKCGFKYFSGTDDYVVTVA